jgi:beta-mannosidase
MHPKVSCHVQVALTVFEQLGTKAGAYEAPHEVPWHDASPADVPCTLFGLLQARGQLDLSSPPDLEAQDFWFRARLPEKLAEGAHRLVFDGLAGIVDVWLGGAHQLRTENMFRRYELALTDFTPGTELVLRFASLSRHLAQKRPRPRFRTRLVDAQQLRWVRTSLLGRTPGFSPRVPVLGPYRAITLSAEPLLRGVEHKLAARVCAGRAQLSLTLSAQLEGPSSASLGAVLVLQGSAGSGRYPLEGRSDGGRIHWSGDFEVEDAALWWPHSHGAQPRSGAYVELTYLAAGFDTAPIQIALGQVGFRELAVDRGDDGAGFSLLVNGQPVFCRGACWTVNDLVTLSEATLRDTLILARDAGMNMLRVGGTTLYESDAFYDACDELGIMVFQDFMFANMDYPVDDPTFQSEVRAEALYQLRRMMGRPALSVLCGGSEVEQQAAMLGLGPALAQSSLFYELLPALAAEHLPEVPYVPNSPSGGALPFQVDAGIAHYYGVGAYLRPLHDARVSGVRFAAECLAFANVPNQEAVEQLLADLEMPFHHPRWKERVPRDRGVGWDFEDVRDHYLELLYHESARSLRYADPERYLSLSRAVVVDVMEATLAELRRANSSCAGSLVWWLKDMWLGAGWGVLDSRSVPKSAYYALRRAFAPRALLITDEGMNGPALHVFNDRPEPLSATLSVTLIRDGSAVVASAERPLELSAHSVQEVRADAMFERFVDAGYVYRFGPTNHDLLVALLRDGQGALIARAVAFVGSTTIRTSDVGLSATSTVREGRAGVLVRSERFARRVEIELDGSVIPEDNYFHLEPGGEHWVPFRHAPCAANPTCSAMADGASGRVRALNAPRFVRFEALPAGFDAAPEVNSC